MSEMPDLLAKKMTLPFRPHYADMIIGLPAICVVCKQEIKDRIWLVNKRLYCVDHTPTVKEATELYAEMEHDLD